jgi:DNA-binding HxlR family transcriptional regulator
VADRAINILSDVWSFLIICEAFAGCRRFEDLCVATGIPRSTLVERLRRLTNEGILRTIEYSRTSQRVKYALTQAGIDLYPIFIALTRFGGELPCKGKLSSTKFIHSSCGVACAPIVSCSSCCEPLNARDVRYSDRTQVFGVSIDRSKKWSFLIIREAFYCEIHFDSLQSRLSIASNMLSERLKRLVEQGVLSRERYHRACDRFSYRLTPMGHRLYGPLILAVTWNDRWVAGNEPSLHLKHLNSGREFTPFLACDQCSGPINVGNMRIVEMAVGDIASELLV